MWPEFINPAALALQNSIDIHWSVLAFVIGVVILGWLFAGGFVGFFIAAFTPNRPLLKGGLVGIGVAAGAGVVVIAGIGIALLPNIPPIPDALWVVGWAGLIITAAAIAVIIIRRIGRNAKTRA